MGSVACDDAARAECDSGSVRRGLTEASSAKHGGLAARGSLTETWHGAPGTQ